MRLIWVLAIIIIFDMQNFSQHIRFKSSCLARLIIIVILVPLSLLLVGFSFMISFAFLFILYGFIYLPSILKEEYREETCTCLDY